MGGVLISCSNLFAYAILFSVKNAVCSTASHVATPGPTKPLLRDMSNLLKTTSMSNVLAVEEWLAPALVPPSNVN